MLDGASNIPTTHVQNAISLMFPDIPKCNEKANHQSTVDSPRRIVIWQPLFANRAFRWRQLDVGSKLQLPWCNWFGVCHSVACSTFWVDGLSLKRLNIYIYFSCPTIAVRLGGVLLHSLKMKCTSEYHIREASSIDATWWGLQPLAWFLAFWEWCVWLEM